MTIKDVGNFSQTILVRNKFFSVLTTTSGKYFM